jgi:hypothetical protein
LLGISSHENDYRISWALNEHLNFQLVKVANHVFFHSKFGENLEFSQYAFQDDNHSMLYRLISNRCDNGFLLEEYKNIDFLLLTDTTDKQEIQLLVRNIKTISFVSAVFPIDFGLLKNRKRLL